jgi:hypothetical protein
MQNPREISTNFPTLIWGDLSENRAIMETDRKSRFNPYIFGQLTLLLGGVALGLAVLPPAIMEDGPVVSSNLNVAVADDAVTQARLKPFRAASLAVAIFGLCLGPIGWMRERPPVLPVCGMSLCAVALFWYWIVLGIMLAAGLFIVWMLLGT